MGTGIKRAIKAQAEIALFIIGRGQVFVLLSR
jgi:hypothetical protein